VLFLLFGVAVLLWWLARPAGTVTLTIGISWVALFYSALLLLVLSQVEGWPAAVMRWRLLGSLGAVYYCVYILHDAFNFIGHRLLLHATPQLYDIRGLVVSLLALTFTFTLAALSWRFFEKPLIRRGHGYSYTEGAVESSPS
jgi:peptidoglycan/LPS O-acetylase OafA/YrhL